MHYEKNIVRRCKECNRELPSDEHKSLCDDCQNKKTSLIRKGIMFVKGCISFAVTAKKG